MISFSEVPGLEVSPFLLLFMGFAMGVVAGFIGVGGGFMITPALIVVGFPGSLAVGTDLANITGNSVIASLRHRQMGNIDIKLAATTLLGSFAGSEAGVRLVNGLKDRGLAEEGILATSLVVMGFIAAYTALETRRARREMSSRVSAEGRQGREIVTSGLAQRVQSLKLQPVLNLTRSRVKVSLWVVVGIGFFVGALSSFLGVGGGFVMGPALIYLVGIPSHITVGTDLLQIVFTAGYGTMRHTMSGNVLIFASFILLLGASVGTQVGSLATRYVTGPAVRLVLAFAVGVGALGAALKLADVITDNTFRLLDVAAAATLFGGMAILTLMVMGLLTLGILYQRGQQIPAWAQSLCCKR